MEKIGEITLQPIGVVSNSITDKGHHLWKDVYSDIVVGAEYLPGLDGLSDFSHVIVLFWLHKVTAEERATRRARPTMKAAIPELGIFSWHSSRRPNPVGVSIVRLVGVQGDRVRVQGLDAIDGTPVLDLRPYVERYYHVDNPAEPAWVSMTRT